MLKAAGAVEVHLRISSPPTSWPCYYGIDTPSRQELIASSHTTDEIARYVTADTLGYLSLEGLGLPLAGGAGQGAGRPRAQHVLHGLLLREVPRG
jgi:glutamine phosphoribosylpyrophosphate amidotransferase